jgi:ERF superfamily
VHRSSPSIASLAAALAKAQAELVNPEKSMTATIRSDEQGRTEQTFRYAPLSSGLDIVRKTLGQHEIATMQTTAIDQAAGIVNLTTVLAHASGEWIASDWPVCAIAETATPHRMGAALTYARRYALFTLVGIAGEDDVDAPDLAAPPAQTSGIENPPPGKKALLNGGRSHIPHGRARKSVPRPILGAAPSAALRDRLIGELKTIASGDDAALWAHKILRDKNSLTDTDALLLEEAFAARLTALERPADLGNAALPPATPAFQPISSVELQGPAARETPRAGGVDKSQLVHPEPRRFRDKEHVKFVANQPCLICGRRPSDAHHLRFAQSRALGRKVSDEFTVPLCRGHHREVHRCGDEAAWWQKTGIDPTIPARALWLETHPLPTAQDKMGGVATSVPAVGINQGNEKHGLPVSARGRNYIAKPITAPDGPSSSSNKRTPGL